MPVDTYARALFGTANPAASAQSALDAATTNANTIASVNSAMSAITGTAQTGLTTTPVTGTSISSANALLLESPVPANANLVQSIKGFVVTPCNITVTRYTMAGTALTVVQSYTFASGAAGAHTWTGTDFGAIPVIPGEYLAVGVSVAGGLTINTPVVSGAGYRSITGTTAGALNGTYHLEVQVNYLTQTVNGTAVQANSAAVASTASGHAVVPALTTSAQTGMTVDPVTGTALAGASYLLEAPVPVTGYLSSLKFFAFGYATITLTRYTKSGTALTVVASYNVTVAKVGLQAFTPLDFGAIPVNAGEYIGLTSSGILAYNAGTVAGAGFYAITGTTVGALVTANHLEAQVNYVAPNALNATTGNALAPAQGLLGAGQIGISTTPVTGTGIGNGPFMLERQIGAGALYLTSIKVFGLSAGVFTLYRYHLVAGVPTQIASYPITIAAGLNNLTRANFGDIPVNGGEWIAVDGNGIITLNTGTVAGAGWRQISGGGTILNNLVTSSHFEVQINYAVSLAALPAPRASPTTSAAAAASDARSLSSYRAKVAKIGRGVSVPQKIKIVLTGDSWHEMLNIPQQFANICYVKIAKAGEGWISANASVTNYTPLNSSTLTKSGWTLYDASAGAAPGVGGCGPDGMSITAANTTATLSVTATGTELRIYYAKVTGAWRYQVDGGAWTTITGDGSNGLGIVTLTGLSAAAHTVAIDTTVNTGTAQIHGFYSTNTAGNGFEVLKMGNAGANANHYANIAAYIAPILADIAPDAYFMCLGTNDKRGTTTTADSLAAMHSTIKAQVLTAKADCAYVAVIPAPTTTTGDIYPLADYRDAVAAWAVANGGEYVNLCDTFRDVTTENAAGMFQADLTHLNDDGGYRAGSAYWAAMLRPGVNL